MNLLWKHINNIFRIPAILLLFHFYTFGQISEEIKVYKNGDLLLNPWVGGLNNPQFSEADLNFDGINELIVFDRSSNTISVFVYLNKQYLYSPELSSIFPEMINFCLVRDFNRDGIPDLFTFSFPDPASGIKVFKGRKDEWDKLVFTPIDHNNGKFPNVIHYQGSNNMLNIYCAVTDIPVIEDIDGDGDLDILAFEPSGGRIWYFRNMSQENGHGSDSLDFIREDVCWGKILEGPTFDEIILSPDPNTCASHLNQMVESRHAGSNILTIDQNNDGLLDLLITDIDVSEIKLLINNGSSQNAWLSELINNFPPEHPVNLDFFPAGFSIDVNRDGIKDLVFSPGTNSLFAETIETTWFYENIGPINNQQFEWKQNDFLVRTILDFGYGTIPTIADVTGDGLLDLVIGVHSRYHKAESGNYISGHLVLMVNIGTAEEPEFNVEDMDWLGLGELDEKIVGIAPAFGDLDGDGDLDLVLGTADGTLIYLENIAGQGRRMRFEAPLLNAFGIDAGRNAVPTISDVNGNGLLDILIGENLGSLTLFKNTGTVHQAKFSGQPDDVDNIPFFAEIDVRKNPIPGAAAPFYFKSQGKSYIATGRTDHGILLYENDGSFENYTLNGIIPNTPMFGKKTAVALADLNNDGFLELISGNIRGGLSLLSTEIPADERAIETPEFNDRLIIYPNPSLKDIKIIYLNALPSETYSVEILSLSGISILKHSGVNLFDEYTISLETLPPGLFFVKVEGEKKTIIEKIVKIN